MSARKRAIAGKALLYTFLALLALLQIFPLLWVFDYSLQKSGDLFGPEILRLGFAPQWGNYARAFTDGKIPRYLLNSVIVVFSATTVATVLSFCLAYAITRMKWRLKFLLSSP